MFLCFTCLEMVSRRFCSIFPRIKWAWLTCHSSVLLFAIIEDRSDICFPPVQRSLPELPWPFKDKNGLTIISANSLSIQGCIPWGPMGFCAFRSYKCSLTCSVPCFGFASWTCHSWKQIRLRQSQRIWVLSHPVLFPVCLCLCVCLLVGCCPNKQGWVLCWFPRQAFPVGGSGCQPAAPVSQQFNSRGSSAWVKTKTAAHVFLWVFNYFRLCIWSIFLKNIHFAGVASQTFSHHNFSYHL